MGQDGTIFVALAAYREPELADTIRSAVDGAVRPERLRFGVCLQYDDEVDGAGYDSVDDLLGDWPIRLLRFPHVDSRGGCWARHLVQGLYDDEDHTLQVDAHSVFEPGWDEELVGLVEALPGPKPLLTGFPPLYSRDDGGVRRLGDRDDPFPLTLVESWSPEGWVRHPTVEAPPGTPVEARPARMLSGAFVFTSGRWNVEVRQDPEHLYTGEEFALALRSYTHGYDLWNPPRTVVWHRTHPTTNPKYIHDDPDGAARRRHGRACRRLRTLLAGDPDRILEPYSLGSARTIDDYSNWSGVDVRARTLSEAARTGVPPPAPRS